MSDGAKIQKALEGLEYTLGEATDGLPLIEVEREELRRLMIALRDRAGFDMNTLVTAIDHYPNSPRFELVYQFLCTQRADRIRVRCKVTEEDAVVPTICDLWSGASFSEREVFDLFGISFEGHPDLRRLMMPEAYEHHPLRKDFPHQGIEPDKLYRKWDRERRRPEGSAS